MRLFRFTTLVGPVLRLVGDDPTDSTTRIPRLVCVSGDQVHVQMRDGLASRGAVVYPDIKAVRLVVGVQPCTRKVEQCQQVPAFLRSRFKER